MVKKYIEYIENSVEMEQENYVMRKINHETRHFESNKKNVRRQSLHIRCNFFNLLLSCKYFLYQRTVGLKSKSN